MDKKLLYLAGGIVLGYSVGVYGARVIARDKQEIYLRELRVAVTDSFMNGHDIALRSPIHVLTAYHDLFEGEQKEFDFNEVAVPQTDPEFPTEGIFVPESQKNAFTEPVAE